MTLAARLLLDPFQGYAYSYPHKMAYRPFDPPIDLKPRWAAEDRTALFLYIHIPFCEVRCGFCNLFTSTAQSPSIVSTYLSTLFRQMSVMQDVLGEYRFAKIAFGGGTPSFLSESELDSVFDAMTTRIGGISPKANFSFEVSPATVTAQKLQLLKSRGVTRLSIGVQSFLEMETRALGRPQKPAILRTALELIRQAGFSVMNIDLIYGVQGQTSETWAESLKQTLTFQPEEIYLYPLYVRPMTGLHRIGRDPSDQRFGLYRQGRDFLKANGYRQISMRLFRRDPQDLSPENHEGPIYCCQEDGMVGLGVGARSYTNGLHYSSEYAVGQNGVRAILDDYCRREDTEFGKADYGCLLDAQEQRRRHVIKSLLRHDGLDFQSYELRFQSAAEIDFPELAELLPLGLAERTGQRLALTSEGIDYSDTIGPWLFSEQSCRRMEEFAVA
jgi:oxygen-independent coproporphyrinogen-3 oxidase